MKTTTTALFAGFILAGATAFGTCDAFAQGRRPAASATSSVSHASKSSDDRKAVRPGASAASNNRPNHSATPSRPSGSVSQGSSRPGNTNGNHSRPATNNGNRNGWSHSDGYRPPHTAYHPVTPPPPAPSARPGSAYYRHSGYYRPSRPLPPPPPVGYRPYVSAPVITGVFGLTFGTTYSVMLDYVRTNGYTIYSTSDGIISLRNVSELAITWPEATLVYDRGLLVGADFVYPQSYNSRYRYNLLYRRLTDLYGTPIAANIIDNVYDVTWYGGDARGYVNLRYFSDASGYYRYYTTLSYGR